MNLHFALFLTVTIMNFIATALIIAANKIVIANEDKKTKVSISLEIIAKCVMTVELFIWMYVQGIILYIFLKYGNTLEEDTQTLVHKIFTDIMD